MKFLAVLPRFLKLKRKDDEQSESSGENASNVRKTSRFKIIVAVLTAVVMMVLGLSVWSIVFQEDVISSRKYSEEAWTPLSGEDRALFQAVRGGNVDDVRRWLREGGSAHAIDNSGVTPVKAAIALGRADMVKEMVDAGGGAAGDWNALLVYAAVQNRPQIVKEIAKLPLALNTPDKNGYTPLLYAIERNNLNAARELLDAGADPNACGKEGVTPLIAAVTRGKHNMVAELLSAGADWKIVSPSGETAMGIAQQRNRDAIVALLISAETPPRDMYNEYMKLPIESGDISI